MNEKDETTKRDEANKFCFICNSSADATTQTGINFFNERTPINELSPAYIISTIFNRQLKEESAHSSSLCARCFKLCIEFEEGEQRLMEIRLELIRNFNCTALKHNLDLIELEDDEVEDDSIENIEEQPGEKDDENTSQIVDDLHQNDDECQQDTIQQYEIRLNDDENDKTRVIVVQNDLDNGIVETHNQIIESNEHDYDDGVQEESTIFTMQCGTFKEEYLSEDNPNMVEIVTENEDYQNLIVSENQIIEETFENCYSKCSEDSGFNKILEIKTEVSDNTIDDCYTPAKKQKRSSPGQNTKLNQGSNDKLEGMLNTEDIFTKEGDNYICQLCIDDNDLAVFDNRSIGVHLKSVHDLRIYICDICGQDFRKRSELSEHLDQHIAATEDGYFSCDICQREFNNLRLFRIHKRMHYSSAKTWECDQCPKKYSSKNLLDEHMNMHTGQRPYKCQHCDKDFASKYTLSAHMKIHSDRPRPYECKTCNKSFYSGQNLFQHEKTHTGIRPFVCDACEKSFSTQHNLEVHKIVHTGFKPFICRTCGKAFARRAEIKDHERIHTGERPFKCDMCDSSFAQRSNLQSHKRATHLDDKRYQCEICDRRFKRKRLLDYHKKATHTGERPFQCNLCSSTFVYPEHYKKHLRIHSGLKPYSCEICKKTFNSRDNRNAHRFVHSDKKPYECTVCGAGFMRKPLLFAHMKQVAHYHDAIIVNQPRISTGNSSVKGEAKGEMVFKTEKVNIDKDISNDLFSVEYIDMEEQTEEEEINEHNSLIDEENDDDDHVDLTITDEQIIGEELSVEEILENTNFTESMQTGEIFMTEDGQLYETENGTIHFVKIVNDKNNKPQWMKVQS